LDKLLQMSILAGGYIQAQDLARFAFGDDFKRAATDFAIRREALMATSDDWPQNGHKMDS